MALARRARRVEREWLWLGASIVGVAAYYVALQAPVLDPPSYLDPWIYTASFVNFDFLYDAFGWTYYPSRLPWVIPGIVAHAAFGPVTAFFVLHAVFFFGAGVFAYLLFRHWFGPGVARLAFFVLMLSPLFYDAYSNDYPDGAVLTYLFGGTYFGLTTAGARRPRLRAALAGFFLAAAIGTNLFAGVVVACLLLAYAYVRFDLLRMPRALAAEVGAAVGGAVALFVASGLFSVAYGGPFLFFMPQIRAAQNIDPADYKAQGYDWMLGEPQLLLPAFAVACAVVLIAQRRPHRFAVGAAAATAAFYFVLLAWEFFFTGNFLETTYYFSIFNLGIALCLGAAFGLLAPPRAALPAVIVAAILPTIFVFVVPVLPVGRRGAVLVAALMLLTLCALAARTWLASLRRASWTTGLVALIALTGTYAADAGTMTGSVFERGTFGERRDVQALAFELIDFMEERGVEKVPFQFWYDRKEDVAFDGIQSTYMWGITWVGIDMPKVDEPMRLLLEQRKPSMLVLLCKHPSCREAPAALTRAGYRNVPVTNGVLSAGRRRVYVRVLRLPKFVALNRRVDPMVAAYRRGQAPVAAGVRGNALETWSFARGVPAGWEGSSRAAAAAAAGRPFDTSPDSWAYELTAPKLELPAGRYEVFARGRVLAGGLDLGVLDADARQWIQQRLYWYGQRRSFTGRWMATPFRLGKPTTVQVILSNWAPKSGQSRWQLDEIRLVRLP